ncbi:Protein RFT1 like [Pseudolycoriella hygida]|uniref:Protein RFT1 homolog n=1 Tax=Pseudolycoriella hygida TaxID=35572 RepID=A0A9Q0N4X5_9DIPT|nr:Protein RFT1 like [Pseudolycoriella hygida]
MSRNILKSSLKSASFSIIFQIFCRCITFGINAFIVRNVGRTVLGIMNVRLLLLESTLIFLSREAISRASLSSTTQKKNKSTWPQLINQIWTTVPICFILSAPFLFIWLYALSPVQDVYYAQYKFGCFAIAFSCIIEMCAEAPVFVGQVFCFVKLKIVLDTLHILVRSLIFITLVQKNSDIAIYAFGIAQLCSALTIIIGNYSFFHVYIKRLKRYRLDVSKRDNDTNFYGPYYEHMDDFPFNSIREMIPGGLTNTGNYFNSDLQVLILSFAKQGILKQVLTEGEKYVMSVSPVLKLDAQATYDIVNNMGSLAARFIFRPIEDSSYFYFTQTIARDIELTEQNREKVNETGEVLSNICKAVTSIGLLALVFGQSYAGTVLLLYGGSDFVSVDLPETLLRCHCLAIVLLAINGITEGYMFATNTSKQIDTYNYYMAIFSVTFLLLSYQLTNFFGPVGFIWANCTNMIFRISYSTYYIYKQYRPIGLSPLHGILPGKLFSVVLLAMGIVCKVSQTKILPKSILLHLLVGVVCTVITLLAWGYENKHLIRIGIEKYKTKKEKTS